MSDPLLEVDGLKTEFHTEEGVVEAVNEVSFSLDRGETYGIVGESGAGKSVTGESIMRLIESPGEVVSGEIRYDGRDLLSLSESEMRQVRGDDIATIFQDPMSALNPAFTVGEQIVDTICEHREAQSRQSARERTISLFEDVGIPDAAERIDDYPHQFSGGMRQRVLIAMALSCNPDLIIADEPTTALDVTIQAQILDLLDELQEKYDTGILLITHNMGVIARMCDTVGVFYAGKKVEEANVIDLFERPRHPYTVGLLNSIPRIGDPRERIEAIKGSMPDLTNTPTGCSFRNRCPHATEECATADPPLESQGGGHVSACFRTDEIDFNAATEIKETARNVTSGDDGPTETILDVQNLRKYFDPESQSWYNRLLGERKHVHAVDDVNFTIGKGETLGLVGESGCGKSTLGRTVARLYEPDGGTVLYAGTDVTDQGRSGLQDLRSEIQVVFQDPFSSLNPRRTVQNIIGRPLEIHDKVASHKEKRERVVELLEMVGLEEQHLNRYPHEFSGGQKQRIGVARALAVEPDFIVLDEPVSALDVSVQAQVINLLMDLQDDLDLTYLFISHDLNVVQHIADRIAVMYLGELVEVGSVSDVFEPPYHPYTESLLSSIPRPDPTAEGGRIALEGTVPSAIEPPSGCRFRTRCPYAMPECKTDDPASAAIDDGHTIDCHLFNEGVMADKDRSPDSVTEEQESVATSDD